METTYYQRHKEKLQAQQRASYYKNIEESRRKKREYAKKLRARIRERTKAKNKQLRDDFLRMYGNKCVCCGETHKEFLTLEHKNGQKGIKRSRKETGKYSYAKAIKEFRPDLYEILCWNCNCSKGRYGYCPHHPLSSLATK